MIRFRFFKILLVFLFSFHSFSQIKDSIESYIKYSHKIQSIKPDVAFFYAVKAVKLARLNNDTSTWLMSLQNLADIYWYNNQIQKSLDVYFKITEIADSAKFPEYLAYAMYGIGWIECVQKGKPEKINYLHRALNIFSLIHDTVNYSFTCNGLEHFYLQKFKADTSRKDFLEKSIHYNLLGRKWLKNSKTYLYILHQYDYALAASLIEKGLYDSAYKIIQRMNKISKKSANYIKLKYITLINYLLKTKQYHKCLKAIKEFEPEVNSLIRDEKIEFYTIKYQVCSRLNLFTDALQSADSLLSLFPAHYKDLLNSRSDDYENAQRLLKKELSIKNLKEINELEARRNKQKNIFLTTIALALLLSFGLLAFTLRQKKKIQGLNAGLKQQKVLLEEKNHEITQSINYASRIQQALLKQNENILLISRISDPLIFYIPKDIVSGDFYWFHASEQGSYHIGVFDCTGHGVPGAFVSVLNMNLLQEAVLTAQLEFPDDILNYIRSKIIRILNLDENQKDGMDGTLLYFGKDFSDTRMLYLAAAQNPAYLLCNDNLVLSEYDKMPVGKSLSEEPFKRLSLFVPAGARIFLSSDGYKDQFGGPKNKRLGSKAFRDLLQNMSGKSSAEIRIHIQDFHTRWKAGNEQTDDICIVSFVVT